MGLFHVEVHRGRAIGQVDSSTKERWNALMCLAFRMAPVVASKGDALIMERILRAVGFSSPLKSVEAELSLSTCNSHAELKGFVPLPTSSTNACRWDP